jgi:hypothetical protein
MKDLQLRVRMLSLIAAFAFGNSVSAVRADEVVRGRSSVTETKTTVGDPTIIQHIDSKMQPTVVQSRVTTDPTTGAKEHVVEPLIMERQEKLLDTTIIQPEMTETKTTTEQTLESRADQTLPEKQDAAAKSFVPKESSHGHHLGTHTFQTSSPKNQMVSENKELVRTTEIVRKPSIKETFIQAPPDNKPPAVPQVIQKTE